MKIEERKKIQINYLKIKDLKKYDGRLRAMRLLILPYSDEDIKWLNKVGLIYAN